MNRLNVLIRLTCTLLVCGFAVQAAANDRKFSELDVFDLEYVTDPQISPDGSMIAYARRSMDIMTDRAITNIWVIDTAGKQQRPLLSGIQSYSSPRWSPSGDRLAYVAKAGERGAELYVRWMDTGQTALLTNLPEDPGSISWSPDGAYIAFEMFVPSKGLELAIPPAKPDGAKWAPPVKIIDQLPYRADGQGYLETGYSHLFIVPADGGTPRQLTSGDYDHNGPMSWSPDGSTIVFAANRIDNPLEDPMESEIWSVDVQSGKLAQLSDRDGPDYSPAWSPDGKSIAYLGFDDQKLGYHNANVYVMDADGRASRSLTDDLDRSIDHLSWGGSSRRLVVSYDDRARKKLAGLDLNGKLTDLVDDVGSANAGRPYTSGAFSVADNGVIAYTLGTAVRPAELGVIDRSGNARRLTQLNEDLFARRDVGTVEEINWPSSVGDYEVQGWLIKPPGFDPAKKYPLILEIHGGPFTAYGPSYSPELQLYASAGYVVLYANPRGSTSYGAAFANEIHHNYPSRDYDDLMSGVDAAIRTGYIDAEQLFVTGGSGGGVLTAWIVGKTDRFRAAVVAKPVINWLSFVLTSDGTAFFVRYWFDAMPWEKPMAYWERSPLSLVGNVKTPTMLLVGEEDFRTPIAESEQYYQALKLRGVDTALVRVPESSHTLVARPSHLIAKVSNILAWFERYRDTTSDLRSRSQEDRLDRRSGVPPR
ncbi:MAG TPA: S9 family peptidase [Woeseiaceae bacterium]|nr:S9 family peptidase [Woeseiaceae bacterium]